MAALPLMMAAGSEDPTKAAFPFLHGHALAEAGHAVRAREPKESLKPQ